MKNYIKLYEEYNSTMSLNEEWFPQDIYLISVDEKISSYLEFYGDSLEEITGKNRNVDGLINMIKSILENPSNVNSIVKANILGKFKKGLKSKMVKKVVKSISIQIKDGDESQKFEVLSKWGELKTGKFYTSETIRLILHEPLVLELQVFGLRF